MYQSTYFIDVFSRRDKKSKNQVNPLSTSKICTEQVAKLKIPFYYIELHLNLKRLGFTGEPVT